MGAEAIGDGRYSVSTIIDAWRRGRENGFVRSMMPIPLRDLEEEEVYTVMGNLVMSMSGYVLGKAEKTKIIDKSPSYTWRKTGLREIKESIPGATYIHLVRDFRSVWVSIVRMKTFMANPLGDDVNAFCDHILGIYSNIDAIFKQGLPVIGYEDMCSDFETTMNYAMDIIGVPLVDAEVLLGGDRLSGDRNVDSSNWEFVPKDDIRIITKKLAPLLTRFGYEV